MLDPKVNVEITGTARGLDAASRRARNSLRSINNELTNLRRVASGVLSFTVAGVGVRELVRVADAYGQINARVRLATQYTNDFTQVQRLLAQSATETRAPLQETADLYVRLSPSLIALGRNAQQSVGVITTVNQAIALSGATAQASEAALIQFGQGIGSGILRGQELNSILEQAPGLADAIAEGLGVARGELRQMGADGELTSERIVEALEKVRTRVQQDFEQLPVTVGQSFTLLSNAFMETVGTIDQATGSTAALGRATVEIADWLKSLQGFGQGLRPVFELVFDFIDGVSRLFRILGRGLAAFSLINWKIIEGDIRGAVNVYKELDSDIRDIVNEPFSADKRQQYADEAERAATARKKVEEDLARELGKLEDLRAVQAGKASADILKDARTLAQERVKAAQAATKEEIRGAEALQNALRRAWQESINGAREAREEAQDYFDRARDALQSAEDRIAERQMEGLSDEERAAASSGRLREVERAARNLTDQAIIAASEGRIEEAVRYAEEAEKSVERASSLVDNLQSNGDAEAWLRALAKIRAEALTAAGEAKEAEAREFEEVAQAQQAELDKLQTRLDALKAELAKPVEITLDIEAAEQRIENLRERLKSLGAEPIVVPVTPVMGGGGDGGLSRLQVEQPDGTWVDAGAGFARGGYTGRGGKYEPAGIVHRGEFVLPQEIVRRPGVIAHLNRLLATGKLPGYSGGGLVRNLDLGPNISARGASGSSARPLVLDLGQLGRYDTTASADVADQLARAVHRAALQRGRRKS